MTKHFTNLKLFLITIKVKKGKTKCAARPNIN